mmetsp:Transcript_43544/g.137769  ORF Transcript_43544/g.137769 Transcript_43544/m.137769 type:complete len:113 (-) Transcript_43544:97-435(-)
MEQARQLLSLLSSQRAGYRDQLQDTFVEENAHRMRLDLSQLMQSDRLPAQPASSSQPAKRDAQPSPSKARDQTWRDEGGIQYYSNTIRQIKERISKQGSQIVDEGLNNQVLI